MRIPSGSTDRYVYFVAVDSTDFTTRETGLTSFTVYRSRNGAAAAAMTTPTVNETDATNMPGVYELLLDEDTTLTAGNDTEEICFHITQASMAPVTRVVEIYRPETTEGNTLDVTSGGAAGIDWGNVENKTTTHAFTNTTIGTVTTNTDLVTAAAIRSEMDSNSTELAKLGTFTDFGSGTTVGANLTDLAGTSFTTSTDSLEAIRDRGDAAWTTGGGGSDRLLMVDTTIATLSSQTSFTLTAGSTDDDSYNGCTIVIEDASTSTQKAVGIVDDYTGSTKTVTLLEDPGVFTMAATDKVYILAEKSLKPTTAANYHVDVEVGGCVGVDWANVANQTTAVDLSATDIQLCDTVTTLTNLPAITSNWLTAAGIAASALDGKGDWNTTTPPTAAAIADQVWDEAQADHVAAGSFGLIASEIADILVDTAEIGSAGAGLTAIPWNASWDAEVESEVNDALVAQGLDHLVGAAVTGTDVVDNSIIAKLVSSSATADWDSFVNTTDSLQAIKDSALAATDILSDGTALNTTAGVLDVVNLTNTTTTNTDMRGTDNAALASALATAQADLDTITGSDGVTLATTQGNYAPATAAALAAAQTDLDTITDTGVTCVALTSAAFTDIWSTDTLTEAYAADGAAATPAQAVYLIMQHLSESSITGTTKTVKKLDGSTTAATFTLDDGTTPTSITRAT